MTSQTSQIDPTQATLKHLQQKGRLSNWMGLLGGQILKRTTDEQHKTYQAQQRWVRKQWGSQEQEVAGEEMGHTFLGDVTQPAPIIVAPPQQSSGIGPLLAAGLGMLGPAGAIGGFFLNQMLEQKPAPTPTPQVQQIQNTENLGMRLLRESDLQSPFDVDK